MIVTFKSRPKKDQIKIKMRDLLTAVTKILSSAYCILIVAIYVVIVVNRFTHFTPENHHDVEV